MSPLSDARAFASHPRAAARALRRCHREREAPAVAQAQTADRGLQWTGEPVGAEVRGTRVALELVVGVAVAGTPTRELIHERTNRAER